MIIITLQTPCFSTRNNEIYTGYLVISARTEYEKKKTS